MRVVVQRVTEGSVSIPQQNYEAKIGKGFVVLLGIKNGDTEKDSIFLADKCSSLRIFEDENEKINLSLKDIDGEMLVVSQFTLY
ncbi:MAG TPA: D-aminoacyl-tRNA deacylase, partial [Ignavibacteriaceae bacterium]|nr:D-aminoacyl-tRNA deacylase [Ignavibacteriaceae bacterium]